MQDFHIPQAPLKYLLAAQLDSHLLSPRLLARKHLLSSRSFHSHFDGANEPPVSTGREAAQENSHSQSQREQHAKPCQHMVTTQRLHSSQIINLSTRAGSLNALP